MTLSNPRRPCSSPCLVRTLLYSKRVAKGGAVKLAAAVGALVGGSMMVIIWAVAAAGVIALFIREKLRARKRSADEPPFVWVRSSHLMLLSIVLAEAVNILCRW